jgi:hypothetical protein
MEVGDQETEVDIDRRIGDLRRNDRNPTPGSTDEVYYECLLRTQFEQDKALDMLRHNRPNLVHMMNDCCFKDNLLISIATTS